MKIFLLLNTTLLYLTLNAQTELFYEIPELSSQCTPALAQLSDGRILLSSCDSDFVFYLIGLDSNGNEVIFDTSAYARSVEGIRSSISYNSILKTFDTVSEPGDSSRLTLKTYEAIDSLLLMRIDSFDQVFSTDRGLGLYLFNNVSARTANEIHRAMVQRFEFRPSYAADIYSYHKLEDTVSHLSIPLDSTGSSIFSITASDSVYYLWSQGERVAAHYRDGRFKRYYEPFTYDDYDLNNPAGGGTLLTGFFGDPTITYFDSSLYLFSTTMLYGSDTVTAMHIQRLSEDFELLNRKVVDTTDWQNTFLFPAWLNQGSSITPDGNRLYLVASGSNEARDTMTWHIHSFGDEFEQFHDIDLHFPYEDGFVTRVEGILALRDGGAVVWGRGLNSLRLYKISPDSNFVSAIGEVPWPTESSKQTLPFAYPNPVSSNGEFTLDSERLPTGSTYYFVSDPLGRIKNEGRIEKLIGQNALTLPDAPGVFTIGVLDTDGRLLSQQRLVRQ